MTTEKPAHVQRMIDEHEQLSDRTGKLHEFIDRSPIFLGLAPDDQALMRAQFGAMTSYLCVLGMRIERVG